MFQTFTLAERPELRPQLFGGRFASAFPEFMNHDPAAELYYPPPYLDRYLDCVLVGVDSAAPDLAIAKGFCVPFRLQDGSEERAALPDGGWSTVIRWAHDDQANRRAPNAVSALEISIVPEHRGTGLSRRMLEAMRALVAAKGIGVLYAPVRPTGKHLVPQEPMETYIRRVREDGLPQDDWLRTHMRLGGRIVQVAPCSMVIAASLAGWRGWTGLAFDRDGATIVPGALSPVHVSLAQDNAVYVEPNVWVEHRV
jgi:GNAT superfamily N-acetyltransferase